MQDKKQNTDYDRQVSLQRDNHESSGTAENQNREHNARKEGLGGIVRR